MDSFWTRLPKPFFVLAPMADVTDPAYRRLIAEYGKPDVTWTEFVSADGLYHTRELKRMPDEENPLMRDLGFTDAERPIVAQLFGANPETMAYAAKLCAQLGFDGIDINMGCPDRSIEKQGAGAAMMKHPEDAPAIIRAAQESGLPVSVKTRMGYTRDEMDTWVRTLLAEKPVALTMHLRTRKEMSLVPAHWEEAHRIPALRDRYSPDTLVLGNGDVKSIAEAKEKAMAAGLDGVMIGRGIFGNPWVFAGRDPGDIPAREKLEALRTLSRYFDELRPRKSLHILKKHFKAFVNGWPGAAELRAGLMECETLAELETKLQEAIDLVG
jgi:nifR3 family TIM-barrel protein